MPADLTGLADGYAVLLAAWWPYPGDLVIIEHDNGPTRAQVAGLLACREPACTLPYALAGGELSLWEYRPDRVGLRWVERRDRAGGSALGCVKLSPAARARVPLAPCRWDWTAEMVSDAMHGAGIGWHVHPGTCRHDHRRD